MFLLAGKWECNILNYVTDSSFNAIYISYFFPLRQLRLLAFCLQNASVTVFYAVCHGYIYLWESCALQIFLALLNAASQAEEYSAVVLSLFQLQASERAFCKFFSMSVGVNDRI